jgi:thiamine-phosphate pyrophosphorylase
VTAWPQTLVGPALQLGAAGRWRPRVVLVTDPAFADDRIARCIDVAARALPAGWLCVQLRDKRRAAVSLRVFAMRLRVVTRAVGAGLILNGDARIARDVGADGVHLGRDGGTVAQARAICGEAAWISVAAHSDRAVTEGVQAGADAVLVSPVFDTRPPATREGPKTGRGLDAVRSARAIAGRRTLVYALGGVDPNRARACVEAGAHGVAVLRALLASAEPARVASALHDAITSRC